MSRYRFLAGLIPLALILLLPSCTGISRGDDHFDILALKGPSSVGMVHLIDSPGSVNGRPVRIRMVEEPMQARAVILKERPEVAVLPLNMAAILYNKGLPYQVAAVPVWGTLYLCGTDSAIRTWQDLKGRKVNLMGRGATPDLITRYLLQLEGIDPDRDLSIDYAFPSPADLANAMVAGIVEVAVLSEPMFSLAQARNPEIRLILDFSAEWERWHPDTPGMPQTAILVNRKSIWEHPDDYRQILLRWRESTDSVIGNPRAAAGPVIRHRILPDSATAILSIPRSNLSFVLAAEAKSTINRYLSILLQFSPDAIGRHLPDEGFIYQEPHH